MLIHVCQFSRQLEHVVEQVTVWIQDAHPVEGIDHLCLGDVRACAEHVVELVQIEVRVRADLKSEVFNICAVLGLTLEHVSERFDISTLEAEWFGFHGCSVS